MIGTNGSHTATVRDADRRGSRPHGRQPTPKTRCRTPEGASQDDPSQEPPDPRPGRPSAAGGPLSRPGAAQPRDGGSQVWCLQCRRAHPAVTARTAAEGYRRTSSSACVRRAKADGERRGAQAASEADGGHQFSSRALGCSHQVRHLPQVPVRERRNCQGYAALWDAPPGCAGDPARAILRTCALTRASIARRESASSVDANSAGPQRI
jgi:hypothetical protein